MFPFDGMPKIVQYIGEILPNTHFIRLTRGIMLRGASLSEMQQELLALGVFTSIALSGAIIRFTKRLD
jgi:ABC-2 type transport system permease protein